MMKNKHIYVTIIVFSTILILLYPLFSHIVCFLLGAIVSTTANILFASYKKKREEKKYVGKLGALDHAKIAEYVEKKQYQEAVIYMLMKAYNLSREEILYMTPEQVKELVSKIEFI